MSDLIDRLKAAWAMLNDDGDEYGLCDTLSEAIAALEAARVDAEDAERYRWVLKCDPEESPRAAAAWDAFTGPYVKDFIDTAIDQARGEGVA